MSLEGKRALITGSSRNLGAEIARELSRRGCQVAVTYRAARIEAERLVEELTVDTGARHIVIGGDLSTGAGAQAVAEEALAELSGVDILVNNAGPFAMEPFAKLSEEDWDYVWDTNVKAAYICTRVLAPAMRQAGWGRIVNLSAGSAYIRNHSIYTLAKSAMITLTEELALELAPEVTVNAVSPGQILESAEDMAEFDSTFVERATAATPLRRLVTRPEVSGLIAEMCGPTFDMVTGATIPIDGGWRIHKL